MFKAENDHEYKNTKSEFNKLFKEADTCRKICDLYIPQEISQKIIDAINNIYDAYLSFLKVYRTDPNKLNNISQMNVGAQKIKERLSIKNLEAYEKLDETIDKLPQILGELSSELRREMFLKGIN